MEMETAMETETRTKPKPGNRKGNPFLSSWKKLGGFPYKLTEGEILLLFNMLSKTTQDNQPYAYQRGVLHSGLAKKIGVRKYYMKEGRAGDKACMGKVQYLINAFNQHPGLMTSSIREQIEQTPKLARFYKHRQYEVVSQENSKQVVILNKSDDQVSPLVNEENTKTEIMENILDKMQIVLDNITVKKIQAANLGTLSKSLENLMKSYQMFKGEVGSRSLTQINIGNLTLEQKRDLSRNMAEAKK